jgi:hypothetical protein
MLEYVLHNVRNDPRLSASHLSLYFVLFMYWVNNEGKNPIEVKRREIMKCAKLSTATYTKCIKDLDVFGYISYCPSYHPAIGSRIFMQFDTMMYQRVA